MALLAQNNYVGVILGLYRDNGDYRDYKPGLYWGYIGIMETIGIIEQPSDLSDLVSRTEDNQCFTCNAFNAECTSVRWILDKGNTLRQSTCCSAEGLVFHNVQ